MLLIPPLPTSDFELMKMSGLKTSSLVLFCRLIVHNLMEKILGMTLEVLDYRLPPRCKLCLRSYGMLLSVV